MKRDKLLVIEEFVHTVETHTEILKDSIPVLLLTPEQEELFNRATKIITKKLDKIKDAETKDKLNKHLKVKKLLGDMYE